MFRVGFHPRNPLAYRMFNIAIALLLIIASAPAFLVIALLLFVTQGREILYRGPRLGRDRRRFHILKFRTLCSRRAGPITRHCTLPRNAGIETPLGGLLRDTRLDELPQLFNILKGDMNICGPRPVRPEIAAIERRRIPDYDLRFAVKPGLIGPTQAYFGHATSKRIRARMNHALVRRPVSIAAELALLGRIGLAVLTRIVGRIIGETGAGAPHSAPAKLPARRPDIRLTDESGDWSCEVEGIDATTLTARGLPSRMVGRTAILYARLRSGALRKARLRISRSGEFGVFRYAAETDFGEFVIERYALGLVVLPPRLRTLTAEPEAAPEWERACA